MTGLTGAPEDVGRIRDAATALLAARELPPPVATDLAVVLDELASNLARHGARAVRLAVAGDARSVVVTVDDDGPAFDPTRHPPPNVGAPLDRRPVGGLGLYLVRHLVDVISYERVDGWNRVVVRKTVSTGPREG